MTIVRTYPLFALPWIIAAALATSHPSQAAARKPQLKPAQLAAIVSTYLAGRGKIEGVTGAALYVDLGAGTNPVEGFAGQDGLSPARPIDSNTLFQIGSNTKHFTAALILMLEARGVLNIGQTIGDFLPDYPAWRHVTIRSLLNMTSDLPNYTETVSIGRIVAADIHHQFSNADLLHAVYPGSDLPRASGYFYSNTNNILAALIIEKVTHVSFSQALEQYIIKPLQLTDTYYAAGAYPDDVTDRLPRGAYENCACLLYQPQPCTVSTLAPLAGKDMRKQNMSWAGAAGAIIASPADLAKWVRAVFGMRVLPSKQLAEMTALVSQKTGRPIAEVSPSDPRGFGLDLGRVYDKAMGGTFWFYQGDTLGFRTIFAYWPQYDLLITGGTNSQPPEGEDRFGPQVFGAAFHLAVPNATAE
jgi:D-alanyl-D-alanine carboxypeptidase